MARTGAARKRQEILRSTHRQREFEWIETHADEMRRLAGEWAVLEGDQHVAHGMNASRVFAAAERKGIAVPFVFYVEPALSATGEGQDGGRSDAHTRRTFRNA